MVISSATSSSKKGLFSTLKLGFSAIVVAVGLNQVAVAQEQSFEDWLVELRAEAADRGISDATLDAALTGIQPIPRVIELDRKQPEFTLTFQEYLDRVVPQSRKTVHRRVSKSMKPF